MPAVSAWICAAIVAQAPAIEPAHAANAVYRDLRDGQLSLEGTPVPFPAPLLRDGQSADEQRAALRKLAGTAADVEKLTRDSVTAPYILKPPHDLKTQAGDTVRTVDLYFLVHADLDAIDPADAARAGTKGEAVEAGNMRFEARLLSAEDLKARDLEVAEGQWYVHHAGRLLDRVQFGATDLVVVTRSRDSLLVASRTAAAFDRDRTYPNAWRKLFRNAEGKPNAPGPVRPYPGGGGYAKVSRLASHPGALLVEVHSVFTEPREWFEGAPILRSKIVMAVQDQVRSLRRKLAEPARR